MTAPGDLSRELRTERLLLRRWRPDDRDPFAALNADPRVMEHFPGTIPRAENDAGVDRIEEHFERHGFGPWAVELPGEAAFIGFIGLAVPRFEASFTPCVEVAWRLAAAHWRRGYATEGAQAALRFAFLEAGLDEVLSFTVPANVASRRVMDKIGLRQDPGGDFEHPLLPPGHRLRRHLLYRLTRSEWVASQQSSAFDRRTRGRSG